MLAKIQKRVVYCMANKTVSEQNQQKILQQLAEIQKRLAYCMANKTVSEQNQQKILQQKQSLREFVCKYQLSRKIFCRLDGDHLRMF